jgi:hypothetical protein
MGLMNKLGGRKMALGLLIIGLAMIIETMIGLSSNMLILLISVTASFYVGNAGEHLATALKEKNKGGTVPIEEVSATVNAVARELNDIKTMATANREATQQLQKVTQGSLEAINAVLGVLKAGRG